MFRVNAYFDRFYVFSLTTDGFPLFCTLIIIDRLLQISFVCSLFATIAFERAVTLKL